MSELSVKSVVEATLENLKGFQGGTVEFDLAIYPVNHPDGVRVSSGVGGSLSRVRFSIKTEATNGKGEGKI